MNLDLNLQQDRPPLNPSYLFNSWTKYNKTTKRGFFTVSNALENYLPYINSAALNLYIFYAIHAKNEEGSSFYSNESIAQKLHVTQKTVTNWNNTLQDLGLITRKANYNSASTTYLLPLSDFIIKLPSGEENKHSEINTLLKNEGYKLCNTLYLNINSTKNIEIKYYIFKKTYQNNKFRIIRHILLEQKEKDNLQRINTEGKDLGWCIKENKKIIIWTPTKANDNTYENRLKLVSQIDSPELFQKFKENYPQISIDSD